MLCIQPFYTPWYCLSCNWINDPIFQGKFSNSFYVTRVLASFEFSVQRALELLWNVCSMTSKAVFISAFFVGDKLPPINGTTIRQCDYLSSAALVLLLLAAAEMTMTTIYLPLAASSTTDFFLSTGLVVFCSIEKPIPKLCHQVCNNPIFGKVSRLLGL